MSSDRPKNQHASRSGAAGDVGRTSIDLVLSQSSHDASAKKKYLSLAEAHVLVERAKSGDAKAWRQLCTYYAGMLRYTVMKMEVPDAFKNEAIAEALIALQVAVAKYPPGDPEHFSEYARRCIQRGVRRYARSLRRWSVDE